jgi:hypothetical protein
MQTTVNTTRSVALRVENISVILSAMNNSSKASLDLLQEDMTSLELNVLHFEDLVYRIEIIRSLFQTHCLRKRKKKRKRKTEKERFKNNIEIDFL